jgi:serine/threonine-protein kinase
MTRAGVILGTAAYMSPEQAKGKPVDRRADIFAFGCVLYELLTGKKAFEGETITETLGAIIHKEPDWKGLPSNSPSLVRFLLNRCLQKDVSRRLQHIDGARILIEEALTGETTASAMGITAAPTPGWKRVMTVALVVVAVIATGISIWSLMKPASPLLTAGSIAEFSITLPPGTTLTNTNRRELAISADGRHIVYRALNEGRTQLYLRSLDDQEAMAISGTEGAGPSLFLSPDGESVAFTIGSTLMRVGVTGGAPVTIGDAQVDWGGGWGSEDIIVFGSAAGPGGGLYRISASGGEPKPIMIPDPDKGRFVFVDPQILPGGEAVLYGESSNKTWVVSMETGERKMVLEGARSPRYASTGHLVYETPGTGILMAAPFDLEKLEVTGDPVLVLEGVRRDTFLGATLDYQFSDSGTLIYVPDQTTTEHELVWVDRQGTESLITQEKDNYRTPRISPDGKRVAVTLFGGNERSVWIYDLEGDSFRRLTFEGSHGGPTWSPDGRWIVYGSGNSGVLYKHLADGSGLPQKLTEEISGARITDSWSPDGRMLAYNQRGSGGLDIWMLPMDGDGKPQFFTSGAWPKFSPDGQWVAYVRTERGQRQVYVSPYSEPGVQWLVSGQEGGAEPVWSPDGTELFYRSGDQMMVVSVQTEPTFNAGRPRVLFEGSYLSTTISVGFQYYDISPDGQRFLMIKEGGSGHTQINVVLNWFEELKRLVPTN